MLHDKKVVAFKLDKEMHAAIRIWSFQRGVTTQEIFVELTRCILAEDKRITSVIDSYILRNLSLPKISRKIRSGKVQELSDGDKRSLYDLINSEEERIGDIIDSEDKEDNAGA